MYSKCEAGYCKEGCLDVVRDIFNEPCFKGHNLQRLKEGLKTDGDPTMKYAVMDYFYRIDSCNSELAAERKCGAWPNINAARGSTADFLNISIVTLFLFFTLY